MHACVHAHAGPPATPRLNMPEAAQLNDVLSERSRTRRAERDRRDGTERTRAHQTGMCGDMASLCGECYADERADLLAWAREQPDPRPEEEALEYWRRIGGRFLDAWHDVASARIRETDTGAGRHRHGGSR